MFNAELYLAVQDQSNRSWHVSFCLFSHELTLQASISHAVSRWAVSSAHSIRRHLQTCPTTTWTMSHYPFARATHSSLPRRPPNSPLRTSFPLSSRMRTSMGTVTLRTWERGTLPCQGQPRSSVSVTRFYVTFCGMLWETTCADRAVRTSARPPTDTVLSSPGRQANMPPSGIQREVIDLLSQDKQHLEVRLLNDTIGGIRRLFQCSLLENDLDWVLARVDVIALGRHPCSASCASSWRKSCRSMSLWSLQ